MKLTELRIGELAVETGKKDRLVFDHQQRGLAVRITAPGGRSYLVQYTLHGRKFRVPLGACSGVSLADARLAAAAIMGERALGKNPAHERREAAARAKAAEDRLTLGELIDLWSERHLAQKRTRYATEATRALRLAFAKNLDRAADELGRDAILRVLDGFAHKKRSRKGATGLAIASRTAAYGCAMFGWAIKRGTLASNPFANLPSSSPTKRERVLTDDELVRIYNAATARNDYYGAIVRLLLLTGQRRDEVGGMCWHELSDDLATWTIQGERTKNRAAQVVPLSPPALEVLLALLPEDPDERQRTLNKLRSSSLPVFRSEAGTPFAGWSKCKTKLDEAAKASGWRLHDLRRTLATGLQKLGVRLEVTEAVLNHVSGSRAGIVGVYQRHDWKDEKRAALVAWGERVRSLCEKRPEESNVVPLTQSLRAA